MAKTYLTPTEHAATLNAYETLRRLDYSSIATLTAVTLQRWLIDEPGQIKLIRLALAVGGTVSDGALEVRKNGVLITAAAFVLANAQTDPTNTYQQVPATEALSLVEPGDLIELVATSVPTGSSGLTVQISIARRYALLPATIT